MFYIILIAVILGGVFTVDYFIENNRDWGENP